MSHNRRLKLLEVVQEAVSAGRYQEITAAKLASLAGISKATLFHHFKSLDELILESFKLAYRDIEAKLAAESLTFTRLKALLLEILVDDNLCEQNVRFILFAMQRAASNKEFAAMFRAELDSLCETIAKQLNSETKKVKLQEVKATVLTVFAVFDGLSIYRVFAPDQLKNSYKRFFPFIFDAITTGDTNGHR